jgi:hypothetical protein
MTVSPLPLPTGRSVPASSVQGSLALDLVPRVEPPELAEVVPISRDEHGRLEAWAQRFSQALLEIVGGDRPATQLVRWTSKEVYDDILRRTAIVARAGRHTPGQGRVQPVRPQVVSVRTCVVGPRVAEVSARVRYGARSRAVALRFERSRAGWICTAMELA